ncbi:hypothetical protein [Pseudoalteromonas sp. BSi20495]|uniref:hypothetical protein n=1 Tax=Pseudoalteromonas sp. BSi20495 TaxID=386429 RepID=UPI000231639B|nr:hypothetical protein [Pseudoalteromonas sp. BSi20495]GAA80814.1 hypothetical protein P20495_3336 [Pseudoalteromonas sp. BSi20495]
MYAQVEKPKENTSSDHWRKSRAVPNSVAQKKSNVKQGFGFVDNRPEAIAQRRKQGVANSYSVQQLQPIQKKHLPQEAWCEVQKKQKNIKLTKQLKAEVQVDDKTGEDVGSNRKGTRNTLERELIQRRKISTSVDFGRVKKEGYDGEWETKKKGGEEPTSSFRENYTVPLFPIFEAESTRFTETPYQIMGGHIIKKEYGGKGGLANVYPWTRATEEDWTSSVEDKVKAVLESEELYTEFGNAEKVTLYYSVDIQEYKELPKRIQSTYTVAEWPTLYENSMIQRGINTSGLLPKNISVFVSAEVEYKDNIDGTQKRFRRDVLSTTISCPQLRDEIMSAKDYEASRLDKNKYHKGNLDEEWTKKAKKK